MSHHEPQGEVPSTTLPFTTYPFSVITTSMVEKVEGKEADGVIVHHGKHHHGKQPIDTKHNLEICVKNVGDDDAVSKRNVWQLLKQYEASLGAMAIMATGALAFSVEFAEAKLLEGKQGPFTAVCLRGLVGMLLALLTALISRKRKGPLYGHHRQSIKFLVLKGFLGGTATILAFLAVKVSKFSTSRDSSSKISEEQQWQLHGIFSCW